MRYSRSGLVNWVNIILTGFVLQSPSTHENNIWQGNLLHPHIWLVSRVLCTAPPGQGGCRQRCPVAAAEPGTWVGIASWKTGHRPSKQQDCQQLHE